MNDETTNDIDANALDQTLTALFADVRPSATLEDRTVRSLRADTRRKYAFAGWQRALAYGLAASVGLGLVGVAVQTLPGLKFPGELDDKVGAHIHREAPAGSFHPNEGDSQQDWRFKGRRAIDDSKSMDLSNQDAGVVSELKPEIPVTRETPDTVAMQQQNHLYSWLSQEDFLKESVQLRFGYFVPDHVPTQFKEFSGKNGTVATTLSDDKKEGAVAESFALGRQVKTSGVPAAVPAQWNKHHQNYYILEKPVIAPYVNLLQNPPPNTVPSVPAAVVRKIVIRSGDMEFEVESFDGAFAAVQQLVEKVKGAYVGTVNSDKLPNGKVKGSIVVRIPPENLDALVLDLRRELGKSGELKGQRIGSQDITKQYTDIESRLKASRTMEERLLKIIAEGKGEIKQLLEAEKELGVCRTRIEEAEGELRYYSSQVSLSTLTINLAEREIRTAAGLTESERVQAGVEVEDVDAAYRDLLKAVADAKGRVGKAELKQLTAGQFSATLHFDVAPEAAGPMRDRLRQLGRVARLEIDRVQIADGGSPVPKDAKVKRGDTAFQLQLYNLANIQPRETVTQQVATADVKASYKALQDAVARAKGRVLTANVNETDRDNVGAQFVFEVQRADEGAIAVALTAAGEVLTRSVTRAVESDKVTDSKVLFHTTLVSADKLKPRETTSLTVEVPDVDAAAAVVAARAAEVKARTVDNTIARDRTGQVTAKLVFAVPLAAAPALIEKVKAAGTVRVHDAGRDPQAVDGAAAMARISVTLTNVDPIVASDDGLWPQVRKGLSISATTLLKSVMWVIFGACVMLPWAIIGYTGYRLLRRTWRPTPVPEVKPVATQQP